MQYVSTRKHCDPASFFEAFANGMAPDGGLYVPEALPNFPADLVSEESEPYPALAVDVLELFDTDHSPDEVFRLVDKSYSNFTDLATAPLKQLDDNLFVLELFHGPTLSFKDFGLQLIDAGFETNTFVGAAGRPGSRIGHGIAGKANNVQDGGLDVVVPLSGKSDLGCGHGRSNLRENPQCGQRGQQRPRALAR